MGPKKAPKQPADSTWQHLRLQTACIPPGVDSMGVVEEGEKNAKNTRFNRPAQDGGVGSMRRTPNDLRSLPLEMRREIACAATPRPSAHTMHATGATKKITSENGNRHMVNFTLHVNS